jgi:sugar lactone lactonase YvrE
MAFPRSLPALMNSLLFATCVHLLLGVFSAPAHAQSVIFAGAQTTVPASDLNGPYGVAADGPGDVFIVNSGHSQVLEIPVGGGAQTTVPASGLSDPEGAAVDGAGDVFIADTGNNRVVEVPAGGGSQTTVGSGLSYPNSVAADGAGDVFVVDVGNHRVVEVWAGGGSQTTVGVGLIIPYAVAVDGAGDAFIADVGNNQVVEVPAGGGPQTTVASGLDDPSGVAVDRAGDVFIADRLNNRVVEVPAGGAPQTTVGGGLNQPTGVAVDGAGDVVIADYGNNRVVEVQRVAVNFGNVNVCPVSQNSPAPCNQTITLNYNVAATTTFGTTNVVTQGAPNLDFTMSSGGTCTGAVSAGSSCTVNVTFAPLAPGLRMGAVQLTDNSGNLLVTTMVHGIGQGPAIEFGPGVQTTLTVSVGGIGLTTPIGVAVDAAGDIFIADYDNNRVVEVPAGGGPPTTVGSGLGLPVGVAVDGAGNVFIADAGYDRVVEVRYLGNGTYGAQTTVPASGLSSATGVAVDGAGDVFIADSNNHRVVEVPAGGGPQTTVGTGLDLPFGVAVDGAGDVFIADQSNNQVVEVPAGGGPQTTVGTGLSSPRGVAVDGAGDVVIADSNNSRVVEVPVGGGAQTTVGGGLVGPYGVAMDGVGDVFIADYYGARSLEVQRSQPPALTFASTAVGSTSSDSPQSVTIQNIGNQSLNAITPGLVVGGPNFLQVAGSGTPLDCASSFALTPGATCNLSISFEPQSAGNLTSTATFTDNTLNTNPSASQGIALQGTGVLAIQTITFTTNAPASAAYNSIFTVAATASSGLAVTFASAGSCGNSGANYTMISGTGNCSVIATQAGNSMYAPAQVSETVTAVPLTQAITFTTPAPPTAKSGDSFTVAATGGASGNPVTFTVGAGSVCTLSGATYTMTSDTGTCSVIANQADNSNYAAAPQVTETVTAVKTVKKVAPTVTFTGAPANATYLSTFTVATTQNSGVTPVITSTTGTICSVSGEIVTMKKGTGICTVKASWATNDYYLATSLEQSTTATSLGTTTTITSAVPEAGHPLKVAVYFSVTNGTAVAVTGNVTVTAGTGQTCTGTVTGGKCVLTFTTAESTILTATYEGNTDDSTSTSAPYSLTVY